MEPEAPNIMNRTNHTLILPEADTLPAIAKPEPAVTSRTDDEIRRLAGALNRYVAWLDGQRQWREDQAAERRHRRQHQRQQHANHDKEVA